MGIETVAVYSQADAEALHVKFADEAVCIGPAPRALSYLNIPAIISAAEITGADAHPPGLRLPVRERRVRRGLRQVRHHLDRPAPDAVMRLMGDKIRARAAMTKAGVPVLPGSGVHRDRRRARGGGRAHRLPGDPQGGGRRRRARHEDRRGRASSCAASWQAARTEAQAGLRQPATCTSSATCAGPATSRSRCVADEHGHYAHLGERECSIQRRHQKLVEEAPSRRRSMPRLGPPCTGAARQGHRSHRLPLARHAGVPARRGRQLLLHGDEHARSRSSTR